MSGRRKKPPMSRDWSRLDCVMVIASVLSPSKGSWEARVHHVFAKEDDPVESWWSEFGFSPAEAAGKAILRFESEGFAEEVPTA